MVRLPPTQLTLRLAADRHAPGIARSVIRSAAQVVGAGIVEVAELLVSELVTNSVRHAHLRERDAIEVRMTLGRRLRVEVLDAGPGFRWSTAGPHTDDAGGFGLVLLGRLAESWGIGAGPPACVWFELAIGHGVSSAPSKGNAGQDASRRRSHDG